MTAGRPRYALQKDENHAHLRLTWRHMGGSWLDLVPEEKGTPDALLGFRDVDQLVEFKMPGEDPRREQVLWHRSWRGRPVVTIRTPKDLESLAREMSCPKPSKPSARSLLIPPPTRAGRRG